MSLFVGDTPSEPSPGRRGALIASGLVLLLALGAMAYWWRRPPATAGRPAASPAPSPTRPQPRVLGAGSLQITVDVPAALVLVDGRKLGMAPQRLDGLTAGPHRLRIEVGGHAPWEQNAHVVPGVTSEINVRLTEAQPRLRVESDVEGASVFVDQKYAGQTPLALPTVTRGSHRVTVSAEGYDMYVEMVDVTSEPMLVSVRFREVHLAERLDVTHRHGLGSCRGRLSANESSLRYEAEGSADSFDVPLASVERLEVDYLRKNLAVRLSGGRTYNFTVRSGGADPLLVFQQKVEKARQRLAVTTS
jgi:hypothetical protein